MAIESLPKLNFSVPLAMTAAMPVDYNSYFDDYDKAVAAALTAEEIGSSNTIYHYGQEIIVITKASADLYLIQPDRALKLISSSGVGDDKTFVFTQSIASDTWDIQHDLNKYPSIAIVDSGNNIVYGDVEYVNKNNVVCKFTSAFSGKAYLN